MSEKAKQKPKYGVLFRVLSNVGPYRGRFILTGVLVVLSSIFAPIRLLIIQWGMDKGIVAGDRDIILYMFLGVVGFLILESVLQFFKTYIANWVAQSVTLDLRGKLYQKVVKFRLKYFDNTPVGTFVTRLISDIDGIAQVFSDGILNIIGDILTLIVVIGVMFWTNWKLTLIVLVPIPILIVATKIFQVAIKRAFQTVRNKVSAMNVYVQEHVTGMSVVQIFNRENREKAKFDAINKDHLKANIRSIWAFSIFFPLVELFSAASVALVLWWGVNDIGTDNGISLGVFMQFVLSIFLIFRPIRQLADRFNTLQMGVVNAERVFDVFDTDEYIKDEGELSEPSFDGAISFRNVWFAYNDEDWVLKDVSFEVKAGETVAFVGATGAGKSSVINLLSRFYEFQKGEILIDGKDLRAIKLDDIRNQIAVVLQDVFLFSDTIKNNVTLNDSTISLEDVKQAAEVVGAADFISRLPEGYEYDVRERGGMLSVGQRQLLAFMRAYVYQPKLLILDEATSSVDTESEMLIQNAIEKLTEGRTSIVIAHRLSTIQKADKIIVLDQGKIVEMGTHNELLQQDGQYRKLFELQFQE